MKPYDFKMFKKVLFEIQSGVKVYLNDEYLNSLSSSVIKEKFDQSVIGDIVVISKAGANLKFKRKISSWIRVKGLIVNNLLDVIDNYFDGTEGHRNDKKFIDMANRIQGKVVDLVFIGDDAFEEIDNNYYLPSCCYRLIF